MANRISVNKTSMHVDFGTYNNKPVKLLIEKAGEREDKYGTEWLRDLVKRELVRLKLMKGDVQ